VVNNCYAISASLNNQPGPMFAKQRAASRAQPTTLVTRRAWVSRVGVLRKSTSGSLSSLEELGSFLRRFPGNCADGNETRRAHAWSVPKRATQEDRA